MKATEVVTAEVRLSYANVYKPKAMSEGETEKYSSAILIPKTDKVTVDKIHAAVEAAKQEGKNSKWGGKIPGVLKLPLRDGDDEKPDDDAYQGMWFLNASSIKQPQIVDENMVSHKDKEVVYSGCFVRVALNFYAFAGKAKGVACGLNAIKKLRDGDALSGGSVNLQEAFGGGGDFDDDL